MDNPAMGWNGESKVEEIEHKPSFRHYAALLCACLFWGVSFVATKHVLGVLPPLPLVFARFFLSSLILMALSAFMNFTRISGNDLKYFLILCIFEPGLYYMFETYGLTKTDPTSAALIIASIPVQVILVARFATGEQMTGGKLLGAAISICGVVLVTTGGMFDHAGAGRSTLAGNLSILAAAVLASAFTVLLASLAKRYPPLTITRFQVFFAAVFYLPFGLPGLVKIDVSAVTPLVVIIVIFLAVFAGVLAFLFYNYGLSRIEAGRASVFLNTIPMFTAATAWLALGERLSAIQVFGGILVLGGVVAANRPRPIVIES